MIRLSLRVLTKSFASLIGFPASSQVMAPAGTMVQPSLDASFITSQTSAIEPGETFRADWEKERRGDAETLESPMIRAICLRAESCSNGAGVCSPGALGLLGPRPPRPPSMNVTSRQSKDSTSTELNSL